MPHELEEFTPRATGVKVTVHNVDGLVIGNGTVTAIGTHQHANMFQVRVTGVGTGWYPPSQLKKLQGGGRRRTKRSKRSKRSTKRSTKRSKRV